MKQSKIKVLLSKKERNNNYILNINIKKKNYSALYSFYANKHV